LRSACVDGLMVDILAQIFTVGAHVVLNIGILSLGWDRHIWDIRPEWIRGMCERRLYTILDIAPMLGNMISKRIQ
jgi:hypothetical protein